MSVILQPPKPIEEMTEEELQRWEELVEEHEDTHSTDAWDTLYSITKLLEPSHLEGMHKVKKHSRLGKYCPYYLKAKKIFMKETAGDFFSLLEQLKTELEEDPDYVRSKEE